MLVIVRSQLLLILVGICNMLFATDAQTTRLGANAQAAGVEIELRTGKSTYVEGEPIYFDILATNYSNSIVKMNEPLIFGWGGYTFKNLSIGVSITDNTLYIHWEGIMHPFLLRKSAERDVGTLGWRRSSQLLPQTNKRYFISVTKHFIINGTVMAREYTPGLEPNFRGTNDDFFLDFLNNSELELANSDKYLSIMHMSRLASKYLSRTAHDGREHGLRSVGLKYKERLSNQFADEPNERQGKRQNIDIKFYAVDRVIAPERINRIGERRTPRTEAEN